MRKKPNQNKPNIILIVFDTLRADRLGFMGYDIPTSPNLDKLAKKSLVFKNCFAPSSWTMPSHASLFTGVLPVIHRVNDKNSHLNESIKNVAEILTEQGYKSYHISNNPFSYWDGLKNGFNLFAFRAFPNKFIIRLRAWMANHLNPIFKLIKVLTKGQLFPYNKKEKEIIATITKIVTNKHKNRQPYFVFANFLTTHSPLSFTKEDLKKVAPKIPFKLAKSIFLKHLYSPKDINRISRGRKAVTAKETKIINHIYDASVHYLDRITKDLFNLIAKKDNTYLFIMSDHGEILGDYKTVTSTRIFGHFLPICPELLKIPMLIYCKNIRPQTIKSIASLLDVVPTLSRLCGFKAPFYCQGINLLNIPIKNRKFIESQTLRAYYYLDKSSVFIPRGCLSNEKYIYVFSRDMTKIYPVKKGKVDSHQIPSYNFNKLAQ